MKKMGGSTLAVIMVLGQVSSAWGAGAGTSGANILNFGVGARAIAMGEAYTALADDSSSLYWNPAGIALLNQSEASFMYNQSFQDLNYSHGRVAVPLENSGLGASLSYLGYGDIDGYNEQGTPTGNVDAHTAVATVGGGWFGDFWSAGLNAKAIRGVLADESANAFAVDLGGNFIYPQELWGGSTLRLGGTVRNLGTGMKYLQYSDPLPTEYRAGVALLNLVNKRLNVSMDIGKKRDDDAAIYAGAEFFPIHFIALRAGYAKKDSEGNGIRAGLGLHVGSISFDYAYENLGDLGLAHRYELAYRFGTIRPFLTPEMRRMLRQARRNIKEERYSEAVLLLDALLKMAPDYSLFKRLEKVALAGYEQQERLASNQQYRYAGQNKKTTIDSAYEAADQKQLEELLNLSETEVMQVALPDSGTKAASK